MVPHHHRAVEDIQRPGAHVERVVHPAALVLREQKRVGRGHVAGLVFQNRVPLGVGVPPGLAADRAADLRGEGVRGGGRGQLVHDLPAAIAVQTVTRRLCKPLEPSCLAKMHFLSSAAYRSSPAGDRVGRSTWPPRPRRRGSRTGERPNILLRPVQKKPQQSIMQVTRAIVSDRCNHRPALAAGHVLEEVEAERPSVADRSEHPPFVAPPTAWQASSMTFSPLRRAISMMRLMSHGRPPHVDRNHRLGPRPNRVGQCRRTQQDRLVHVHDHRDRPDGQHRHRGGHVRVCRHDDLVPRPDGQRPKGRRRATSCRWTSGGYAGPPSTRHSVFQTVRTPAAVVTEQFSSLYHGRDGVNFFLTNSIHDRVLSEAPQAGPHRYRRSANFRCTDFPPPRVTCCGHPEWPGPLRPRCPQRVHPRVSLQ